MTTEEFNVIVEKRLESIKRILITKSKEYAISEDRLYNFRRGAKFTNKTPYETLWGYLTKHLVSIHDMVEGKRSYTPEAVEEKIGDAINYLILLEALLLEEEKDYL